MSESSSRPLSFSLYEAGGELHAQFNPGTGAPPPDPLMLKQAVKEGGWEKLHIDDRAIDDFVASSRNIDQLLDRMIGVRRDGEFSVTVDSDLMTAWLTLVPPQGGKPVMLEEIGAELSAQGIVYGVLRSEIDRVLATGFCDRIAIAYGDEPKEGMPTRFETLYDKEEEAAEDDELDRVRYSDLCYLTLIKPGDKLMRRYPPVPGKNGTNVKGHPILPQSTPDIPFRTILNGAAPDKNDPTLLVATSGGQPTAVDNGVTVNPVIEVLNVDLSTGSIEFEGTLHVGGDIKAGMRVKVSGDVIVNGAMEAAEVIAGGNVAVRGGIVGHPDSRPGSHALPETTARIFCEGSVQAMFMENVHVEAGKSIMLGRTARQCELIAREEIIVGKGKGGQIIGGRTQATIRVATAILGTTTGAKTYVQVGINPYLEKQIADKDTEFKRTCDELDRVVKLLVYFKQNPAKGAGGVAEKVEGTRKQLMAKIDTLTEEIKALRAQLELAEQARVEVGGQIYYGVEVRIGQQVWQPQDDMGRASLELQGGKIAVVK